MLPPRRLLREQLERIILCKETQGHETCGLKTALHRLPERYDSYATFAERLRYLPLREDWPYVEPNSLEEIWAECDPTRPSGMIGEITLADASSRAAAAFAGAVAGCILGKPLEFDPTLAEIRQAAEKVGEWPLRDYISEPLLEALGRRHVSWTETVRDRIHYVTADDDLNYLVLGMLLIEEQGLQFSRNHIMQAWLRNLAPVSAWGPERVMLLKAGIYTLNAATDEPPFDDWVETWNPNDEACGAAIRVDAYGYACPGQPALAAELAWRDAGWTHRRTGIYGAMFIAAAVASAFVVRDRLAIFETALRFVPRRSRFYEIIADSITLVRGAGDWLDGYHRINEKYGQYRHCMIYQEVATLVNTVQFASSVSEGICLQVSQGCDTDCFGKIAGSILGAYFGPGYLDPHWLAPFRDCMYTGLADFHEQSLAAISGRMAQLPAASLAAGK